MSLHFFNFMAGFVVDYMNNILLGVTKLHTELILHSTRKTFWHISDNIGMSHVLSTIDERFLMIHPPSSITRLLAPSKTLVDGKHLNGEHGYYFTRCHV